MNEKLKKLYEDLNRAETLEEVKKIGEAIEAEKMREKLIAEKQAALDALKGEEGNAGKKGEEPRTLGEFAAKNLDLSAMRAGASKSAGTGYGFKVATDPHVSTPMQVVEQRVIDTTLRSLDIRNLFGAETISGTSIKYFVLGATEGAPATVAENAPKPQFHVPYASKDASLQKIAGWYYETDELLEDNAFLASSIDNRGLFELDNAVEGYLMTTLGGTSGILTPTITATSVTADDLFKAAMSVKSASQYDADAIVINPVDYQILRLAKDGNQQYYGGGYFTPAYTGAGAPQLIPGLWGMNTVVSASTTAGTAYVGAFRAGGSVITKAGEGVRVEVVTGDHDDRTHNRVTVIVEERLLLAVRVPSAFAKVVKAS